MMDFPSNPTVGQQFSVTDGPTYTYDGAKWKVLTPGSQFNRTTFTATAGQAVFSVVYPIGAIDVFRNGVKLSGADFSAVNGTTITLANACNAGDTVEVISYAQVVYADAAKATDVYSTVRGFKNRIINGDMRIDQRNAGASVTPAADQYVIDRWTFFVSQSAKITAQQNAGGVTPPPGFTHYFGITSTSAFAIGAGDYFGTRQFIEGCNFTDLAWGTADAKPITLSFWVRSSLTGVFGCGINNAGPSFRSYVFSYTINAANTWEHKTVTIPGDMVGSWAKDNAKVELRFCLGVGATASTTPGVWNSALYASPTGATSLVGTNGATFYITGVQLEVGAVATPFERREYGEELRMCQRYYFKATRCRVMGYAGGVNDIVGGSLIFPVTMRAGPTASVSTAGYEVDNKPGVSIFVDRLSPEQVVVAANNINGYLYTMYSLTADAEL